MDWNRLVTLSLSGTLQGRQSKVWVKKTHLNSRIADDGLTLLGKKPIRFLGRSMSVKAIEHRFHHHELIQLWMSIDDIIIVVCASSWNLVGQPKLLEVELPENITQERGQRRIATNVGSTERTTTGRWMLGAFVGHSCCFLLRHFVYRSACCVGGVTTQNAWRSGRKPP